MTETEVRYLTAQQRHRIRRWLIDDIIPDLLPQVGVEDSDQRPWGGWHAELARGRLARLRDESRASGRHPDRRGDMLQALGRALSAHTAGDVAKGLEACQRAISHHAAREEDRKDARRWRERHTVVMETILAQSEPPVTPVGISEIARCAGVGRDTVDEWTRRHPDFPEPRWLVGGRPAWNWPDIAGWLEATGRDYTGYAEAYPFR